MRRSFLVLAFPLVVSFVALAVAVHSNLLRTFDSESLTYLQRIVPQMMDLPFSLLSSVGAFEVTLVLLIAVLWFAFPSNQRVLLLGLFLAMVLVEWLGKNIISQPGPGRDFHRYVFRFSFPTGHVATPFSFPSGHAARSAFLTILMMALIARSNLSGRFKALLAFAALGGEFVMLVSRVSLGDHWSSDVLGGLVLGLVFAMPSFYPTASLDLRKIRALLNPRSQSPTI